MYFFRKPNNTVCIVYNNGEKLVCVPRSEIKHLDAMPDDKVREAVKRLAALYKVREKRPDLAVCPALLQDRINEFLTYLGSLGRRRGTLRIHKSSLLLAGSFFGWPLTGWPDRSRDFAEWTREAKLAKWTAIKVRQSVMLFWDWCLGMGYVHDRLFLLRVPTNQMPTPLRITPTPAEALKMCLALKDGRLRLFSLLSYFFSLRPQETVALHRDDFTAGDSAEELECCLIIKKITKWARFAVRIERQRDRKDDNPWEPKVNSVGWVACIHRPAAETLVMMLKELPDGPLFAHSMDWYRELLSRQNLGWDFKDLRRASLYWLGHHTSISRIQLKGHSRHRDDKSLDLYMRRPDKQVKRSLDL